MTAPTWKKVATEDDLASYIHLSTVDGVGELIVGNGAAQVIHLDPGVTGQYLRMGSTYPEWAYKYMWFPTTGKIYSGTDYPMSEFGAYLPNANYYSWTSVRLPYDFHDFGPSASSDYGVSAYIRTMNTYGTFTTLINVFRERVSTSESSTGDTACDFTTAATYRLARADITSYMGSYAAGDLLGVRISGASTGALYVCGLMIKYY